MKYQVNQSETTEISAGVMIEALSKIWLHKEATEKALKGKLKEEGLTINMIIIQQVYYKKPNVQTTNELMMSLLTLWMTLRKWGVSLVKLVYHGVCKVRENIYYRMQHSWYILILSIKFRWSWLYYCHSI